MNTPTNIKASFTWSLEDYRVYCRMQRNLSILGKYGNFIQFGFDIVCIGAGILADLPLLWKFGIYHGLVWTLWLAFGQPWLVKRQFGQQQLDDSERRLEISDTGIVYDNPLSRTDCSWDMIKAFTESDSHFVLWVNRLDGGCIPKRAFASDAEMMRFRSLASAMTAGKTLA